MYSFVVRFFLRCNIFSQISFSCQQLFRPKHHAVSDTGWGLFTSSRMTATRIAMLMVPFSNSGQPERLVWHGNGSFLLRNKNRGLEKCIHVFFSMEGCPKILRAKEFLIFFARYMSKPRISGCPRVTNPPVQHRPSTRGCMGIY